MANIKNVANAAEVVESTKLTPETEFEYVTVPAEDILGFPHPGVAHNRDFFGPGVHRLAREIATEVKERLAIFEAQNLRILQPRKDLKALRALEKNRGGAAVDLTPDNSKAI